MMKTHLAKNLSTRVAAFAIAAAAAFFSMSQISCSPASPKLGPPPVYDGGVTVSEDDAGTLYSPAVDILLLVDDSGSMIDKQRRLASNIHEFTQALQSNPLFDYHIAVITSTMSHGNSGYNHNPGYDGHMVGNPHVIDRSTPGGLALLERMVMVGQDGNGAEEFFEPIHTALTEPTLSQYNSGFLRQNASLAIVIMTDSEDQQNSQTPQTLYDFLVNLKGGDKSKVLAYGAIIPVNDTTHCPRDPDGPPYRVEEFLRIANPGATQSTYEFCICDPDYGQKLAGISNNLVTRASETLYLTREPVPSTIEVHFGSQLIPNDPDAGWVYDPAKRALHFGPNLILKPQPGGTRFRVTFVTADRP
jgi:hypothetical protein